MNRNAAYYLKSGSLILLILIIFGYAFFQSRDIIFGPSISIESPLDGETYTNPLIDIKGVAGNISYLDLDDRPMFVDQKGNFDEKFLLSPGYNIIKIDAEDKFGTKTEKILQVVLKGDDILVKNQVANPNATSTIKTATSTQASSTNNL